jgi:arginine N-succinyltransferase
MIIVRDVKTEDLDALWTLIGHANAGMTSLKIDQDQLADRIERSRFAFLRSTERAEGAPYVFVMEDTETGALVGTSCIFSKTGGFEPFYAYRIATEISYCELLKLSQEIRSLHLIKIHNGPTEIGSLFLLPEYRGRGCGRLLSLSRFAYIAAHPKRFAAKTIAEMRGNIDPHGRSPFWDAIASHFFKIDFPQADTLSMIDKQFIEDLMPRYPIYLDLLPKDAIECIGRVHPQTEPALALLESQGFQRNGMIDIFDGGPIVECDTQQIVAVRDAKRLKLVTPESKGLANEFHLHSRAIVSTSGLPFRSFQCEAWISKSAIALSEPSRDVLKSKVGDLIWVIE